MAKIILVTGGSRSGKSSYAQKLAESLDGEKAYVATCPDIDEEMRQRIRKHQQARLNRGWCTIEETIDLAGLFCDRYDIFLIDCLTLWVFNLMYQADKSGRKIEEEDISQRCLEVLASCKKINGTIIFVTNEVGMGIVPENAISRRYRDLVGRCNQTIAADADVVTLVTCGIPIDIKSQHVGATHASPS